MKSLIAYLFRPPPVPNIRLPLPARIGTGILSAIGRAIELAYYRGVLDGLFAGVILTMLIYSLKGYNHAGKNH